MISDLPFGWTKVKIGVLSEQINGRAFKPNEWTGIGMPIIRIQNLNNPSASFNLTDIEVEEKYKVKNGDLLFAWSGTPGTSFGAHIWNRGDAYLNQHIYRLKIRTNQLDYRFYYYALRVLVDDFIGNAQGTAGLAHITKKKFEDTEIPLPPLPEQKRIVAKLDTLFAHLNQLKARLQNIPILLKQFRQAVLTQAVTGKLTAEWRDGKELESYLTEISANRRKYYQTKLTHSKNSGIKPRKLDESDFDIFEYRQGYDLPAYWELANLKNICDFITDGEHATPDRTTEGFLLLSARNVQNGHLTLKDVDYVPESEFIRIKKRCHPEPNDILISCSGTIGRVCRVPKDIAFVLVRSVALLKLQSNVEISNYVEIVLRSDFVQNQILTLQKATAQANLFIGPIGRIVIPIPSYAEQIEIVRKVESLFAVADRIEASYKCLREKIDHLPQAILSKAFRGELVPQDTNEASATALLKSVGEKVDGVARELEEELAMAAEPGVRFKRKKG